jgi:AbrB family looped-hinge helix DNA binding protein
MQLTVDRFGRIVLPKAIRDDLGLTAGDRLDVDEQKECVVLRPVRDTGIVRDQEGLLVFSGRAAGDLRAAVAEHRKARVQRASGLRGRA